MGKNMFLIGVGVVTGMVLHHYVIEKSGTHNAFDRAVDQGEAKLKSTVQQVRDSDDKAGAVAERVQDVADAVTNRANDAAAKVADKANAAAASVGDAADKAARKTSGAANRVSKKASDAAE